MFHWGPGMGWIALILSGLFFLVMIALTVWIVSAAVRRSAPPPNVERGDNALRILRERYARGEISKKEFEEARSVLGE
jgi:putative membrane protein